MSFPPHRYYTPDVVKSWAPSSPELDERPRAKCTTPDCGVCKTIAAEEVFAEDLAPAPSPATALAAPLAEPVDTAVTGGGACAFRVGDRVRVKMSWPGELNRGRSATIAEVGEFAPVHLIAFDGPFAPQDDERLYIDASGLERIGFEGATGGRALPSGWRACASGDNYCGAQNCVVYGEADCISQPSSWLDLSGGWHWGTAVEVADPKHGTAPTMLQAMCAALGLKISLWRGRYGCPDVRCWEDVADSLAFIEIEDCARDALERFHARQRPADVLDVLANVRLATPEEIAAALPELCRCPRANMSGHVVHMPPCASYVQPATLRAESDEMRSAARELTASMRPGTPAAPTVERLLELAKEALKAASKAREAALELEGIAARIRAACGGER